VSTTITDALTSVTIKVKTPDGSMFVTIAEKDNEPVQIQINIGKAGGSLQAWSNVTAELCTLALSLGAKVEQLIEIARVTSDRSVTDDSGRDIRSGPDGLAHALRVYRYKYSLGKK